MSRIGSENAESKPVKQDLDGQESGEGRAEIQEAVEESRRLDLATTEGEAVVEAEGDYVQSEEIERGFIAVIDAQLEETDSGKHGLDQEEKTRIKQFLNPNFMLCILT